ncbi:Copper amine oxidase N-terminal domain-containing protein [Geosporobacter subterraneus DSM 17957]|uniref:Copper amine oxidase N-terminal domain-containing protein n=1 Tax=Geosporobacter subterraneus DSM 17957 TaxID=1121919 RepID=A0A1M6QFI4_9FIRM|nr:copper amine oxidase N-terminal domain-containing protein [Geosporobacter subterraneus]SHK19019.1 Copper amine oxidase N-terminal domain-containing protein [Geosporobacter subterraneus DSM 17957]
MQKFKNISICLLAFLMVLVYPTYSLAKPKNVDKGTGKVKTIETKNPGSVKQKNVMETSDTGGQQAQDKKAEKQDMKVSIKALKEAAKNAYSSEEIEKLQQQVAELKATYSGIKTLPIENIVSKNMKMKFDTPPVIKDGRTLIPVRALTEAFGATVDWNSETKKVTIIKGDIEIILKIDSKTATVNGEEVTIDAPAEIMNKRTVIPLRFIVEQLGLKINWDEETETIEIVDEEEATEETTDENEGEASEEIYDEEKEAEAADGSGEETIEENNTTEDLA